MRVKTRHTPAFGVARLVLAPGEAVQAEVAAMVATSYGVQIESARGRGRAATRPAMFTAPAEGGWIDVAPALPGEVHALELDGTLGWCVARGGWLAVTSTLRSDPGWAGFHALFGVEHGFLEHVSGVGTVVLGCCGALDVVTLEPGEAITVEPAHLVAYTESTQCRLRAVSQSAPQSMRTGNGLMFDFAGPGRLLIQTRTARTMAAALAR
ncbi:MAG: AIM24 family protein [Actinomycetota bacterium]|nr:AIM24 family protein [Actinomycetota bacterium]